MAPAQGKALSLEEVKRLYRDPKHAASFGGVNEFLLSLQKKGYVISPKLLQQWLAEDDLYQLHKPSRRRFSRRPYLVQGIDHLWQADLSDVSSLAADNKGTHFLLFVVDAFSKFGCVAPLKDKSAVVVSQAMASILERSGRKPLHLQTDKGTEFVNRHFKALMGKYRINYYTTQNEETKAAFVERLQRTYKTKMYRYFTHQRTLTYLPVLEDLMTSYNHTFHRTIGMAPVEVNRSNQKAIRRKMAHQWKRGPPSGPQLQKGQQVRLSKARYPFGKGYKPQWTQEIFVIAKVLLTRPVTYQVEDLNGELLTGTFYRPELQPVPTQEDRAYYVEKVLKTRKRGKRKQLYVKWEGYPSSFNSWIWEEDFV